MRAVGLFEARQKLPELVEPTETAKPYGITHR
jgi:hypothetical protein